MASSSSSHFKELRSHFDINAHIPHKKDKYELYLQHLDVDSAKVDFDIFENLQFAVFVETVENMESLMSHVRQILPLSRVRGPIFQHVSEATKIVTMKCGPALCVCYGFESEALSNAFQDVVKLMESVKALNPIFLLLSTSGGLGFQPGNIIVTSGIVSNCGEGMNDVIVDGKRVPRPCYVSQIISNQLTYYVGYRYFQDFPPIRGKTMSVEGFYDSQEEAEGAEPEEPLEDSVKANRISYLKEMRTHDVYNINKIAARFASLCNEANYKVGIICNIDVDLLKMEKITASSVIKKVWMERAIQLTAIFIKEKVMGTI